jgi:predicted DNA-binding WGR domain protein
MTQETKALESVVKHLQKTYFASANEIGAATGLKGHALLETLQTGCQQGRLMFDLAAGVYRLRPLTDAPLDFARLEFRSQRERVAHDLLVRRGAVRVVSENRIAGVGLELVGKVTVDEDKREYRPQMVLADEGQVSKAECTCTFFRKQGLKAGPCVHLIALRLCYADQEAKKARGLEGRQAIQVETRTYSKRDDAGEDVVQVSLERHRLKVRRGRAGQPMRVQTLMFNTPEEARAAYFERVDALDAKGYLDATAGAT